MPGEVTHQSNPDSQGNRRNHQFHGEIGLAPDHKNGDCRCGNRETSH